MNYRSFAVIVAMALSLPVAAQEVSFKVAHFPSASPAGEKVRFVDMVKAQINLIPAMLVFLVVIVGIYGGWANPTEAASIGAAACGIIAALSGGMRSKDFLQRTGVSKNAQTDSEWHGVRRHPQ